jgi:hypothetical protein
MPRFTKPGIKLYGSISKLRPTTGAFTWRTGLPGSVFGSAALNGAGVLAVPTYDDASPQNGTYFVNSSTGAILNVISVNNAKQFAQPVFADKYVLLAPVTQGVNACTP